MGTPSGNELVPKESSLHPGVDPPADTVSENSSRDSSSDSDDQSSNASNSSNSKKVKRRHKRKVKVSTEASASESDSDSNSGSTSSNESGSEVSSEPEGVFKTPVAALHPTTVQVNSALAPPQSAAVVDAVQEAEVVNQPVSGGEPAVPSSTQSPVVTTPAKSLVLPASSPALVPVVLPPMVAADVVNPVQGAQSIQNGHEVTAGPIPPNNEVGVSASSTSNGPLPVKEALVEIDFEQILELSTPSRPSVSNPANGRTATRSKKSGKTSKSSVDREEERYLKRVLKVEKALLRTEQGKKRKKEAKKKKGGKQPKGSPKRKKKSKSKAPASSDDDSSDSSSTSSSSTASEPSSSGRIAKIPAGRLLQQCALSRLNELGVVRKPDTKLAEINEALRLIDTFELNIGPQMAFGFFHQVPGTGLPHMVKHLVSFDERYGALVRSVVKFHLLLIQKALTDKLAAVNADQNAPLFLLWQFQNDLARAPSTSTYLALPSVVASPVKTPVPKTPRTHRHSKPKKSASKAAAKSKSESSKRVSSSRKRKHRRSGKKASGSKKKRKRHDSSSDPLHPADWYRVLCWSSLEPSRHGNHQTSSAAPDP